MYFSDSSLQKKFSLSNQLCHPNNNLQSTPTSRKRKASEIDEQLEARLKKARVHAARARLSETVEQRMARLIRSRQTLQVDLKFVAFQYDAHYDCSHHPSVVIGKMDELCEYCGARHSVKKMMNNVIEDTISNGKFKGEDFLLPCIPIITTDMPFKFRCLQFPVRLAFIATINKAQGQLLQVYGLNLENPCFSHGQLYVACLCIGKPSDLQ